MNNQVNLTIQAFYSNWERRKTQVSSNGWFSIQLQEVSHYGKNNITVKLSIVLLFLSF